MMIDVVATSDFIHGKLEMTKQGKASLPEPLAKDLQSAGLVVLASDASENKAAPTVANKPAPPARNKSAKAVKASAQASASDAGTKTGASADVCTDTPGGLADGATATATSVVELPPDVVPGDNEAGGDSGLAPAGPAVADVVV